VTADPAQLRANVARRHLQAGHHRQTRREHAALQYLRGCPLDHQPPGLDGETSPFSHDLKQPGVIAGELASTECADMQHPDHLPAADQRYPEQRPDSLLTQDGIEHINMINLFDYHRSFLGRNATGETFSQWNSNSLTNLCFKALRSGGDKVF